MRAFLSQQEFPKWAVAMQYFFRAFVECKGVVQTFWNRVFKSLNVTKEASFKNISMFLIQGHPEKVMIFCQINLKILQFRLFFYLNMFESNV